MSETVISVRNLSKRYRIGLREESPDTLIGFITSLITSPLNNLRKIKRLTHFYDEKSDNKDTIWAINNISFEVMRGEVVGIIGSNGAGKSTLLKILSQITQPTNGEVVLKGRVASLLEVGTGFHPELTGRKNIYLNGTILGMTKKEINGLINEIIEFSGVGKFIDTPVKRYSSGMRVRLAFSVAAFLEPEILLIDEVLAVGDYEFQNRCLGKIKDISKDGRTIFFVSHNMEAIRSLCTRVIYLKNNSIELDGRVDPVIDNYLNNHRKGKIFSSELIPEFYNNETDDIKLKKIELRNSEDKLTNHYSTKDSINIIIFYDLLVSILDMRIVMSIKNSNNAVLFESYYSLNSKYNRKGSYKNSITIPNNILTDGEYDVYIGFSVPFIRQIISKQYMISFSTFTKKNKNLRFGEKYKGLINPDVQWKIKTLS